MIRLIWTRWGGEATDGDTEPLVCDSSLCQKTHWESRDEVKKAKDERDIVAD